jgi:eukaryotic-like serine/threonine-protein kinase
MPPDVINDPFLSKLPVHEGHKTIGPVALYRKLGEGGMGAVYKGKHLRLNTEVAVKILSPALTADPAFIERFTREAQVAVSLNHPNLVRCFDVNHELDLHYMILEFIQGWELREYLAANGKSGLSENEIAGLISPVASALAVIHKNGVVHRDIKPENIMIASDGRIVLMDLGLAKVTEKRAEGLTLKGLALGTPVYMSPEQWYDAGNVQSPADMWSLGVTMYQLATGDLPFDASTMSQLLKDIMNKPVPDPRLVNPQLSSEFTDLLNRCLQREPDARITAYELSQRLQPAASGQKLPTIRIDGNAKTIQLKEDTAGLATNLVEKIAEKKQEGEIAELNAAPHRGGWKIFAAIVVVVFLAGASGAYFYWMKLKHEEELRLKEETLREDIKKESERSRRFE